MREFSICQALEWRAGERLDARVTGGFLVLIPQPTGALVVASPFPVVLPALLCRQIGCDPIGDRVLLAADPVTRCLAVYPLRFVHEALMRSPLLAIQVMRHDLDSERPRP